MHLHRGKRNSTLRQSSPTCHDSSFSRAQGQTYQTPAHVWGQQSQHCWFSSNTQVCTQVSCDTMHKSLYTGSRDVLTQCHSGAQQRMESCWWVTDYLYWRAAAPSPSTTPKTWAYQVSDRLSSMVAFGDNSSGKADVWFRGCHSYAKGEHLLLSPQSKLLIGRKSCIWNQVSQMISAGAWGNNTDTAHCMELLGTAGRGEQRKRVPQEHLQGLHHHCPDSLTQGLWHTLSWTQTLKPCQAMVGIRN